ncbi:hypothetical protein PHET_02559 [Paragonimus heterotremus]|uniref:C3H1-type domain-containing protein n=1 Tax=Paragonimus heterotremus TaxID=100268 RepID=A0A8J4X1V8_9TREM|nr:hypothetical protein PHET_02559 [Paragonimus heterotremus]
MRCKEIVRFAPRLVFGLSMSGVSNNPYKWVSSSSVGRKRYSTRFKYVKRTNDIESKRVPSSATSVGVVENSVRSVDSREDQGISRTASKSTWFQYHSLSRRRIFARESAFNQSNVGFPVLKQVRPSGVTPARTIYKFIRNSQEICVSTSNCSQQGLSEQKPLGPSYNSTLSRRSMRAAIMPSKFASSPYPGSRTRSRKTFRLVTRYSVRRIKVDNRPSSGLNAVSKQRLQKAISCLRFRRKPVCMFFVKTGKCCLGTRCRYEHDPNYLRICPRFLSHSCLSGSSACPLAHVLDPCRLPVCEFHEGTGCTRVHCPYLHTSYPPNTPLCPAFLRGRCPLGRSCKLRHSWNSLSCTKRKIIRTSSTAPASSLLISAPHLRLLLMKFTDFCFVYFRTPNTAKAAFLL